MKRKRQRNPRTFIDTPAPLKTAHQRACQYLGMTVSDDLRFRMEDTVKRAADLMSAVDHLQCEDTHESAV